MERKSYTINELESKSLEIKKSILDMLNKAKSGHTGGALGMADVFTALYYAVIKHDPTNPNWEERDRVYLSNGHICPVWYATLAHAGYFPMEELDTLRKLNSKLQGHPNRLDTPGVENSSGPLGQGLGQAVGAAIAARMDAKRHRIFCITGDGEHNEGQVWESLLIANKYRLHNLTVVVDRNSIQIDGHTEDVMPLESLEDKYRAFGWHVQSIDGHNIEAIVDACKLAESVYNRPGVIIANTIPGKDVSFMEWVPGWHGKPPKDDELHLSLGELDKKPESSLKE